MRWLIAGCTLAVVAGLGALWLSGANGVIAAWALEGQREAQTAMAGALRRLRAGDPLAVTALMSVCFGYGFFHAAGPGHGKLLIGGYGAARKVGAVWLSTVAFAASLAQGAAAILLVGAGLWLLGLGRAQMTDLADRLFAPLSFAAIAGVGIWLALRGLRGLGRLRQSEGHDGDGAPCATCGHAHAHAPDPAALARATGPRDVAMLIGAVAIRPCTGALFVLILTAQMQVFWAGILGTVAMALGTASVTVAVALASVSLRQGMLAGLSGSPAMARVQPAMEVAVGMVVVALAVPLALGAL